MLCARRFSPAEHCRVLLGVTTIPSITPGAGERKGRWISLALSFQFFIPCYNISDATWDPATLHTKQTKGLFPCTKALQNKVQGLQRKHSLCFDLSVLLNYKTHYSCCNADLGSGHQQDVQVEAHQDEGQFPIKPSSC